MINFLNDILDLFISFLDLDLLNYSFFPFLALAFIATIPAIIKLLTMWR